MARKGIGIMPFRLMGRQRKREEKGQEHREEDTMGERAHSRTGLFMTELILVILFFSIAAACCLEVFARSDQIHGQSRRLKLALNSTENLVWQLRSLEGAEGGWENLAEDYPEMSLGEELEIYFDREGAACAADEADYIMSLSGFWEDGVEYALLESRTPQGDEIYTLEAPLYPREKEEQDAQG